jgi:hypothetical protein
MARAREQVSVTVREDDHVARHQLDVKEGAIEAGDTQQV